MALLLNPLPDAELVLSGSEKLGLLLGVDATLSACQPCHIRNGRQLAYIVKDEKNFALL